MIVELVSAIGTPEDKHAMYIPGSWPTGGSLANRRTVCGTRAEGSWNILNGDGEPNCLKCLVLLGGGTDDIPLPGVL